jgi:predicted transcriptional regulator of viral defense system
MNTTEQKLYEIVIEQHGLFTAKQAIDCGYPKNNHPYHLKAGNWERIVRGIYRLSQFPQSDLVQLMSIYLWSRDRSDLPQGCFSHETALELYELSDINPSAVHLTVPKSYRNGLQDELGKIEIHKRDIKRVKYQELNGLRVTTPLQTLIDLIEDNRIDYKLIEQAVNESFERGLISVKEFKANPDLRKYLRGKNEI